MSKTDLSTILWAGASLLESPHPSSTSSDLKSVLLLRLGQYHDRLDTYPTVNESHTLAEVEFATAEAALSIVERVQSILRLEEESTVEGTPASVSRTPSIGTRDLAELRTLLSIIFKWSIDPLLSNVIASWPSKHSLQLPRGPNIIDLTSAPEDHKLLSSITWRLMALLFPDGPQGALPQTLITTTILNRHVTSLLKPLLALGWLPPSLASETVPTLSDIRPLTMRLLRILPSSQSITSLGAILSSPPIPPHVHKSCTSLLSRQLLRPDGVQGLCAAVFGDEETSGDDAPLEKLENISKLLITVPAGMKAEEYFRIIIPRIMSVISENSLQSYRRAVSFSLSRMLVTDGTFPHHRLTSSIIFPILHNAFLHLTDPKPDNTSQKTHDSDINPNSHLSNTLPRAALSLMTKLLTSVDPSPTLISTLLSPIISALYTLGSYLDKLKTSDPELRETVKNLLTTWGRVVNSQDAVRILWTILNGEGGNWRVDIEGNITRISEMEQVPSLSLLTPNDIKNDEELDLNENFLNLRPDPVHFTRFLESLNRSDISSEIFVGLLEAYRDSKSGGNDPMRTLLYLQLVIQMQSHMTEDKTSSGVLRKPEHILSFVKQALESATARPKHEPRSDVLTMDKLKLIPNDESEDEDSDDETSGLGIPTVDDEMTETAVNLLLSVLEINEDLSARTTSVLNDIFLLLEPLATDSSDLVRPLAREARMVMTARLASNYIPKGSNRHSAEDEDPQEVYQKALKLLQDPILPVRAHGLLLLRQLVSPKSGLVSDKVPVNPALVPGVLSIFLQCIQDDDSYMFLNAVQGLAAMVDTFGREVLQALIAVYAGGLDGLGSTNLTQSDLDKRIRTGEALGQVIRRCGTALGLYVDMLVPPLFHIIKSTHIPTTLRTSSLSLLAECENTHSLALLHYTVDLSGAMIDLLQVETVTSTHHKKGSDQAEEDIKIDTMDSRPTSTNPKFPPLRRAAIHFLAHLVRETANNTRESPVLDERIGLPSSVIKRARITLAYVASTDEDAVVRVMAREVVEELDELEQAMIGL